MTTPQTESPEIAKELGIEKLYFKREDLHPYGSHKGRSIPHMIDMKAAQGAKDFAISSSGNAALAAVRHIQKRNKEGDRLKLTVFVGENMNEEKKRSLIAEIHDENISFSSAPRPLQALMSLVKGKKIESLRQSTDEMALLGYESLAKEIAGTPDLSAIFIGTSSGTTAQALANYMVANKKGASIHIVQTSGLSSIASAFDSDVESETSIADAIVDRVAHRRDALKEALTRTGGKGWVVSNSEIREAMKILKEKAGIDASPNGALCLAGLMRAISKGEKFSGAVVCVITGK